MANRILYQWLQQERWYVHVAERGRQVQLVAEARAHAYGHELEIVLEAAKLELERMRDGA
ncbi:MAG TPA: hypothetical protein VFN67_40780 [Polyangiales bacterium]|nr:hypothetical protein [Polyangiales bacterium]